MMLIQVCDALKERLIIDSVRLWDSLMHCLLYLQAVLRYS